MIALQVYSPPCDVRRGLNVRLRVVVLPDVAISLREKLDPPSTTLPLEYSHCMFGTTTRFSTTVAVQLRVYISPAVVLPVPWMATSGTGRAGDVRKQVLDIYCCYTKYTQLLYRMQINKAIALLTSYSDKMYITACCTHVDKQ